MEVPHRVKLPSPLLKGHSQQDFVPRCYIKNDSVGTLSWYTNNWSSNYRASIWFTQLCRQLWSHYTAASLPYHSFFFVLLPVIDKIVSEEVVSWMQRYQTTQSVQALKNNRLDSTGFFKSIFSSLKLSFSAWMFYSGLTIALSSFEEYGVVLYSWLYWNTSGTWVAISSTLKTLW